MSKSSSSQSRPFRFKIIVKGSFAQPNYSTVPLLLAFLATINAATHYADVPLIVVFVAAAFALPLALVLAAVANRRGRGGLTSALSLMAATGSYAAHGEMAIAASAAALVVLYLLGEAIYRFAPALDDEQGA
jgi:hypothetical protein